MNQSSEDPDSYIDWSGCALVERHPERIHGAPCIVGARMTAETVVECFDLGETVEEICYNYSLAPDIVQALIGYANKRHPIVASERPPLRQE